MNIQKALVAGGIGAAAGGAAVLVGQKVAPQIEAFQKYWWLLPAALVVGGGLAAVKGYPRVGIGIAAAGGIVGVAQYQARQLQEQQQKTATQGFTDAGRWHQGAQFAPDSGAYERGAGALLGPNAQAQFGNQAASAGALYGPNAQRAFAYSSDAMGLGR